MIYRDLHNGAHDLRLDNYDDKFIKPSIKEVPKPSIKEVPKIVEREPIIEAYKPIEKIEIKKEKITILDKSLPINLPYLDQSGIYILSATISKIKKNVIKVVIFKYNGIVYKYDEKMKLPEHLMIRLDELLKLITFINI